MAIRPIIELPDPILRQVSKPVDIYDPATPQLITDLRDTLHLGSTRGVGLAAVQIGELKRALLVHDVLVINPTVIQDSLSTNSVIEGCLSVDGERRRIKRANGRIIAFVTDSQSLAFKGVAIFFSSLEPIENSELLNVSATFSGLESIILQHEMDHLDGVLLIDHEEYE